MNYCCCSFTYLIFVLNWRKLCVRLPVNMRKLWMMLVYYKEDKISLYEFKGYNARQFKTAFPDKGWTKISIYRLLLKLRKFGILVIDRCRGSGRCSAHTDENVNTVGSLVISQENKPQATKQLLEKFHVSWGSTGRQFCGLFTKICVSSGARKGALNSWLKRTACMHYFWYAAWEMITWQQANLHQNRNIKLYSRVFWIFLPNVIKMDHIVVPF